MEFKRLQRLRQIQAQLKQQQQQQEQQQQEPKSDSDSASSSSSSSSRSDSTSSSSPASIAAKFQKTPRDRSKHQLNKLLRLSPVKTGQYPNSTLFTTPILN